MTNPAVFVDTSAWVAFFRREDRHHEEALTIWETLARADTSLLTTEYVLAETLAVVERLMSHAGAVKVGREILASPSVRRVHVSRALFAATWEEYARRDAGSAGFVDTNSFVVMRDFGLRRVFSFDQDFRVAGFELVS